MSLPERSPSKSQLRVAMEARNLSALVDAFAADAEFHSPLTAKLTFKGREQIAALCSVLLKVFEDFHYTEELITGTTGFLVSRARVDGQEIEMVDHVRFGPDGKIQEFTVFFRPLPAAAAALRLIGSALGRRKSRARAAIISALTRPLGLITRAGDRIGVMLVRPTLPV